MTHPGELTLRRWQAGESGLEAIASHVSDCASCRAQLEVFAAEQKQFEAAVPFERFEAQVTARAKNQQRPRVDRWRQVIPLVVAVAALAVVGIVSSQTSGPSSGSSHLKGGSSVEVVVASREGQQRQALEGVTPLEPGDRVRIGLHTLTPRFALVLSVDDAGHAEVAYAEGTRSVAVPGGAQTTFLPESLEFAGAGLEALVILDSDQPLEVNEVLAELRRAFADHGHRLEGLPSLNLPATTTYRLFKKP